CRSLRHFLDPSPSNLQRWKDCGPARRHDSGGSRLILTKCPTLSGDNSMSGSIFLLQDDSNLVKLKEAPYDSEALLQQLLAQYPDLLAGDQIDGTEPRRWLLVCREMAVPSEADGTGRWSLDHLFLDQDAIPTLVEVKRSSDSRIRREV